MAAEKAEHSNSNVKLNCSALKADPDVGPTNALSNRAEKRALRALSDAACAPRVSAIPTAIRGSGSPDGSSGSHALRALNSEFHHMLTWRTWGDCNGDWSDLCRLYLQRASRISSPLLESNAVQPKLSQSRLKYDLTHGRPTVPELCESDSGAEDTEPEAPKLIPLDGPQRKRRRSSAIRKYAL